MKTFLTIFSLLITLNLISQNDTIFNHNYPYEYYYTCNSMQIKNDTFLLSGAIKHENQECGQWLQGQHVASINSQGELVEVNSFSRCNWGLYTGNGGFTLSSENEYVFAGQEFSEINPENNLFFLKLNEFGDTILLNKFYEDTLTKRCWSIKNCNNGGNIIVGTIDSTHSEYTYPTYVRTQTLLIRLNPEGEVVWQKSYSFVEDSEQRNFQEGHKVIETWDNGFIVCGPCKNYSNFTYNSYIMKVDSLGNFKWKRLFSAAPYDAPDIMDIIETKDSCYVICGAKNYGEVFGGLYPYDSWLYKFDTYGNYKWQKTYREYYPNSGDWRDTIYCYFYSMAELDDGRIAVTGQVRKDQVGASATTPFMYLLTPMGDTIFSKYFCLYPPEHPDWVNESFPNKILCTEDGGFAIGGWGYNREWNEFEEHWDMAERIFLIKTDSLGNDGVVISYNGNTTVIDDFKLEIYPNPATNEFNFELPTDIKNDILEIYSTNGSIIYQQIVQAGTNKIDIENLPVGMYLVRIRGANLYGKFVKKQI